MSEKNISLRSTRMQNRSFDLDKPPEKKHGKVMSILINTLNWFTIDEYGDEPDPGRVLTVSSDPTHSFESLKNISIEGRECYSAHRLATIETWSFVEAHNSTYHNQITKFRKAFSDMDFSGHKWSDDEDDDEIEDNKNEEGGDDMSKSDIPIVIPTTCNIDGSDIKDENETKECLDDSEIKEKEDTDTIEHSKEENVEIEGKEEIDVNEEITPKEDI